MPVCPNKKCNSANLSQLNDRDLWWCRDCGTTFTLHPKTYLHIDSIIEALKDGEPHSLTELSTHPFLKHLPITQLTSILTFLADYNFIELDQTWQGTGWEEQPTIPVIQAKLTDKVQAFIHKIKELEKSEPYLK